VGLEDTDPNRAQRLLGGLVETFAQQHLDEAASAASSSSEWPHDQLTGAREHRARAAYVQEGTESC
jgi:hypothetical protein